MTDLPTPANVDLSDEHVLKFLRDHPAFFNRHPEVLNHVVPEERALGNGVVDFTAYQLRNLQQGTKELENKYNGLINFCRDNLSAQSEIHEAVLRIIRARDIEQLLEVIAVDMPALFDLDVVRLVVEAPIVTHTNDNMDVWQQSGVTLVELGVVDAALGYKNVRLVDDISQESDPAIEEVYTGAIGLSRSVAMLKLDTPELDIPLMLAMAVRQPGRFYAGQGVEQLQFLGKILSIYLERYLIDLSI